MREGGAGEPEREYVPVLQSLGRVAAEDVLSGEDIPGFDRSTMDGYAVISRKARKHFGKDAHRSWQDALSARFHFLSV